MLGCHVGAIEQAVGLVQSRRWPAGSSRSASSPTRLRQRTLEGLPSTIMNRGTSW